jgi:ATP adenylyltransferase
MEHLHAPWRIDYILAPKEPKGEDSLFTQIAQSSDDEANLVLWRGQSCYVVMNRYPYSGGHLMVVPYRQVANLDDLDQQELSALMEATQNSIRVLRHIMKPSGFNIGMNLGAVAGAGIQEHLHMHIVPRWEGDTNFMPVIGATAVLPEALEALAEKLRAAFRGSEPIQEA